MNQFNDKYSVVRYLGKGTYGKIFEIFSKQDKKKYACKKIYINGLNDEDSTISYCIYNELIAAKTFSHPNIIKIIDVYFENTNPKKKYICIVMELCQWTLSKFLQEKYESIDDLIKYDIMRQIIEGITHMNIKGYVHNDLSYNNIMIIEDSGKYHVKIIDFGLLFRKTVQIFDPQHITYYVQPPELYASISNNCDISKIDSWSLGMVFYYIYYGKTLINYYKNDSVKGHNHYLISLLCISVPKPKILRYLNMACDYIELYNNLFSKSVDLHMMNDKKMIKYIMNLKLLRNKEYQTENKLSITSPINKFIKKLLNWNPFTRPNIFELYKLFNKLIDTTHYVKEISEYFYEIRLYYQITNDELCIYSLLEINNIFHCYEKIFLNKYFFSKYLDCILCNKFNYDLHLKSICIMSKIYILHYETQINERLINDLELMYDSLIYLNYNIYHHNDSNYFDFIGKIVQIDFDLVLNDAWDYFQLMKINKIYMQEFKILYYIVICHPNQIKLNQSLLMESLCLIIIGKNDHVIRYFLKYHYVLISSKDTTMQSHKITYYPNFKNHKFNVSIINIHTIITTYYIIWIVKNLDNHLLKLSKKWKKLISYLRSYYEYIQ
uniref:Protein kinase domain-containing protein n=1 Tax=viral metagenome TaxID=1070528 RepID=A0A6C0LRF5_9ZZZZ